MKKSLEGVSCSQELQSTLEKIVALPQSKDKEPTFKDDNDDDAKHTCEIKKALSPNLTILEASSFLRSALDITKTIDDGETEDETRDKDVIVIPLKTIPAAKFLLESSSTASNEKDELNDQLQTCLQKSKLIFTRPPTVEKELTKEQLSFQKRLTMLRLRQQERKYTGLTSNIDKKVEQDEAISGMMYATSVGANMIVAPITFGVFMYFFGSKIFTWFDDSESASRKEGQLDIRGVIVGVISGVMMLFIEMILFVIRNHEMDKYLTRKKKTDRTNAFGYSKKRAERTFMG